MVPYSLRARKAWKAWRLCGPWRGAWQVWHFLDLVRGAQGVVSERGVYAGHGAGRGRRGTFSTS
eukprot:1708087-Pyramimonas_sp.AAC.1